jgi:hypothetical protein
MVKKYLCIVTVIVANAKGGNMPLSGYKSVTVPEEAYCKAKELISLGLEESIGKTFENAIKEYAENRQGLVKELKAVKDKWVKKKNV